jgi:transposase
LQVQKEIKDTQQLIETISQQFMEYHLLLTIPGFGPYVTSLVLAVIGDAWRFGSARQVLKMAGFDLSAERSGKKGKEAVPVISKKGNAALRYGVYQAAFIASTRNFDFVCVHPVQIYLDLKGYPERAKEAAAMVRQESLKWGRNA